MKEIINRCYEKFWLPLKYIFFAGLSFIIDQLLFNLLYILFNSNSYIIISKLIARAISSLFNYLVNANIVFKSDRENTLIKYYALVVIQGIVSSVLIYIIKTLFVDAYVAIISICVDIVLFIINYFVQKELIFK